MAGFLFVRCNSAPRRVNVGDAPWSELLFSLRQSASQRPLSSPLCALRQIGP